MEITEGRIREEQGGFRGERGCVDQIFTVKMLAEKYLVKGRKLYEAFMDLEKAYDKSGLEFFVGCTENIWCWGTACTGNQILLPGSKSRCENRWGVESFCIRTGVRQGCVMSPWLFNVYMDGVIKETKAKSGGLGAKMLVEGNEWWMIISL